MPRRGWVLPPVWIVSMLGALLACSGEPGVTPVAQTPPAIPSPASPRSATETAPPAQPSLSAADFWYYAGEQRVSLALALDELAVGFTNSLNAAQKQDLVAQVIGAAQLAGLTDIPTPALTILRLSPGLDEASLLRLLHALRAAPGIAFAYPVFNQPDGRITLAGQFVAQFNSDVSQATIEAFNAGHAVTIVEAMRLPNTYLLRVAPGQDALALANTYHASELTVYAAPDFVRFLSSIKPGPP